MKRSSEIMMVGLAMASTGLLWIFTVEPDCVLSGMCEIEITPTSVFSYPATIVGVFLISLGIIKKRTNSNLQQ